MAHSDKTGQAVCLPAHLFTTQRKMDDHEAADMLYGDITQYPLQKNYKLDDISLFIDSCTFPNRRSGASLLFHEFRTLAGTFSFSGTYKTLIGKLITHMQRGNGEKFSDKLLDDALTEHNSLDSSLAN